MFDLLMVRKRWLMLMVMEYHSGVWKQLGQKPSPDFKAFMTTLIMIILISFIYLGFETDKLQFENQIYYLKIMSL